MFQDGLNHEPVKLYPQVIKPGNWWSIIEFDNVLGDLNLHDREIPMLCLIIQEPLWYYWMDLE